MIVLRTTVLTFAGVLVACSGEHDDGHAGGSIGVSSGGSSTTDAHTDASGPADDTTAAPVDTDDTDGPSRAEGWRWDFELGVVGDFASTDADAILDVSGVGIDGSATAGLRYVEGIRPGRVALAFTGDGAHVWLGGDDVHTADVLADDALRIEVDFRTDVHGRDLAGTLLARGAAGSPGWWLGVVDGQLSLQLDDGVTVREGATEARVDDGVWHRATVSFDRAASAIELTLDGTDTSSIAVAPALADIAGTDEVYLGVDGDEGRAFVGEIDEVAVQRTPAPAITAGPRRATTTVFEVGEVPRPGGGSYANLRIPSVVATANGTLLAFAEGRVHGECDVGDIDIVISRSEDGGATWSQGETLIDPGVHRVWNPIPFVDTDRGTVVLMTSSHQLDPDCHPSAASCACDTVSGSARVEVRISDDDGISFGAPIDVTEQVVDASGSSFLIGPSHGIQLRGAEHHGALVVPAMHRRSGDGKRGGHLLRSDDGGASWAIVATETDSPVNVNESTAAELADGRVLINARHQLTAEDQSPAEIAAGLRGVAIVDNDDAWADDPAYTRVATFRGPVVHGTLLAWPGSERHGDDRRLLFSLPAGEHGTNVGRRHDLRLWVSHDDGASWIDGVRLAGDWAAYSDVVAIDSDHVGVLFEAGADANGFYDRVDFLRAAVQTLDDGTLASWSFEDGVLDDVTDGGPFALALGSTGHVEAVDGRHGSTAVRFDGDARLCLGEPGLRSALDLGPHDSFSIEAWFRSEAHGSGGSPASGVLIGKTRTGTEPAWWLRIEDGHARFLASACAGAAVNCGVVAGQCDALTNCSNFGVQSSTDVSDGAWHRVVVSRDAAAGTVQMRIDDEDPAESAWPAGAIVKNDEALCLGAFADDARGFVGDLDAVRITSRATR